jgi:anti-anti-sigma factor
VVVHVSGELDPAGAVALDRQLTELEALVLPPAPVVVNLTDVTVPSAGGLSPLAKHARSCTRSGRTLLVVAADPSIRHELAGVADVVDTVAEAVARG